ncbi:MAG: flagellar protein FlaG [Pseudomonas sp.]
MTSTISSATSQPAATIQDATQHQRLDRVLRELPGSENTTAAQDPAALVDTVRRINEVMRPYGVEFEMGGEPPRVVTRIVDSASGEMIRQIPSEEVLRIGERLEELVGRLITLEV